MKTRKKEYKELRFLPNLEEIIKYIESVYLQINVPEICDEIYRKFEIDVNPTSVVYQIKKNEFPKKSTSNRVKYSLKHVKGLREVYNKELIG